MNDRPALLLEHHLRELKLPTFLRDYGPTQYRRWPVHDCNLVKGSPPQSCSHGCVNWESPHDGKGAQDVFVNPKVARRAIYILDFDYARHVEAMRELLFRNRQAEVALSDEISVSDERARRSRGEANYFAVEYTVDLMERSIYQEVAHSMAAVGMIAPFMEGVFKDVFERIGEKLPRGDLVKNILNVVERRGLKSYLPCELAPTMEALFRYRNDLFHWGFEWPAHIRQQF